jgi:Uma2 family endonuclease
MVAHSKSCTLTPEEYLVREREATHRSEYLDGVVVAMAGASEAHNTLTFNLAVELGVQLKQSDCRGYTTDMRLRVPHCNRYDYPDLMVVCGDPRFEDDTQDTLLNPTLIVEVLSPSTETKDRGEKLLCYQTLDTLQTYVLVAQNTPRLEAYRRQEAGWLHTVTQGLDATLALEEIGCLLRLTDIYARVVFDAPLIESDSCSSAKSGAV